MATDGQFISARGIHARSSQSISADTVRTRACQAVEYYRNWVMTAKSSRQDGKIKSEPEFLHSVVHSSASDGFFHSGSRFRETRSSCSEKPLSRQRTSLHGNHRKPGLSLSPLIQQPSGENKTENRTLYRSSSNLEMDSMEYSDDDEGNHATSNLRREYGSTSSLDARSTSSEGFFDLVKDYKHENPDQRSPAPPKIQELLRGKVGAQKSSNRQGYRSSAKADGNEPVEQESSDVTQSPKLKNKFKHKDRKVRAKSITGEGGTGIFRKLRGTKGEGSDFNIKTVEGTADSLDSTYEERLRRKAFVHFDCQSIGVNLSEIIRCRNFAVKRKNTSTGASAASVNRNSYTGDKDNPDILLDTDDGDNKSNDLLLSCSFFRNELGGEEDRNISLSKATAQKRGQQLPPFQTPGQAVLHRNPMCCGIATLDSSQSQSGQNLPSLVEHKGHVIEYVDHGALHYRAFFYGQEHQNYFGIDDNLGPVAVSIRRERTEDRDSSGGKSDYVYQHKLVVRTSELTTLRGVILEEAIPSSSRLSSSRGVPTKDVLEYVVPELQLSCLKLAVSGTKTTDQLLKLDEQGLTNMYKVGVMYCKAGQSTEEEMYNNEKPSPAFEEFLECIGQRVRLKGFEKYRGQLDNKTDSTGIHSIYTTFNNYEMMFHVSTLLPFTPNNRQQLLRKRHIGNDIVSIVFQEPGALSFTPKSVRSHFQHVFIIVQAQEPNTPNVSYRIAVSRSKDVPPFGPPIPETPYPKGQEFTDFLLAKVINAENAAHRSEKFKAMAIRTRQEYLRDLATNYVTATTLDSGSKLSKFALGSGRKKERGKQKSVPDVYAKGATLWSVQVEDFGLTSKVDCTLGISATTIVLIEDSSKDVIFTVPCSSILGWTAFTTNVKLYHSQGECIIMKPSSTDAKDVHEIVERLSVVTQGCQTQEVSLKRNATGQLGFHIQAEGIVTNIELCSHAWDTGIRKGSRLVEICKIATVTLSYEQIVDLLRTSAIVKVVVIPPHPDGSPRGYYFPPLIYSAVCPELATAVKRRSLSLPFQNKAVSRSDVKSSPGQLGLESISKDAQQEEHSTTTSESAPSMVQCSEVDDHWSADNSFDGNLMEPHPRSNSQDSSDFLYTTSKEWTTPVKAGHSQANKAGTGKQLDACSANSGSTGNCYSSSESAFSMMSYTQHPGSYGSKVLKKSFFSGSGDYVSPGMPQSGNISLELMKQQQNTKFLLRQDLASKLKISSASPDQLNSSSSQSQNSDASFSSSSSHNAPTSCYSHKSDQFPTPGHADELCGGRKKLDPFISNSKGRPDSIFNKRAHLDQSPASSSNNSSPRSSNRNLSGMSSEESLLSTRLRSSAASSISVPKMVAKPSTSKLQEDLLRLINFDDISSPQDDADKSPDKFSFLSHGRPPQRTMSDESLSSNKGSTTPSNMDGSDMLFTAAFPTSTFGLLKTSKISSTNRLSPRATADAPVTISRQQGSPTIPLVDSAANMEWSSLVNVATKAIEGVDTATAKSSQFKKPAKMETNRSNSETAFQPKSSEASQLFTTGSSSPTWKSVVSNPQQKIQQLEHKVKELSQDLEKERCRNASLESEMCELKKDNQRLQEESQTAAAQLRRFTEWFFSTIDKNWGQSGLSPWIPEKNVDRP